MALSSFFLSAPAHYDRFAWSLDMIISIRNIAGRWQWELYDIGHEAAYVNGQFATGTASTWANMIHNLERCVSELERKHELSE